LAFNTSVPCAGPLTRDADSALPSTSVSFASTPGAATLSGASSAVVKLSFAATGPSLTGTTVTATVAAAESVKPSFVWNWNESGPL
jgi:hypothetical protein